MEMNGKNDDNYNTYKNRWEKEYKNGKKYLSKKKKKKN